MIHTRAGLFFERQVDGSVRVIKTANEEEPDNMNVVVDVLLTREDFDNVIRWMRPPWQQPQLPI
jgi:hypothetical protein